MYKQSPPCTCLALALLGLFAVYPASFAQTARKKPASSAAKATSAATEADTAQFIRANLLGLSPRDFGKIAEFASIGSGTYKITFADGAFAYLQFANLDANSIFWSIVPSPVNTGEQFLRLSIVARAQDPAEDTYFDRNSPQTGVPHNMAVVDFSFASAAAIPDFQAKMAAAIKRLITISGGAPEKQLF